MGDSSSFDQIRFNHVRRLVSSKDASYKKTILQSIKKFPKSARSSGDDSVLNSVWEEFKYQVQREQSFAFDVYESSIRSVCRGVVDEMPQDERALLWLFTEAWLDWDEEAVIPHGSMIDQALEDSFCQQIVEHAENEPLKHDPDEESDDDWEDDEFEDDDELDGDEPDDDEDGLPDK